MFRKWGYFLVELDKEDDGYLKMRERGAYRNWKSGKIEGLVTLVQSSMKLAKSYACWKIWGVYRTIIFDCMHYLQPN